MATLQTALDKIRLYFTLSTAGHLAPTAISVAGLPSLAN